MTTLADVRTAQECDKLRDLVGHFAVVLLNLWEAADGERRVWLTMHGVPVAITQARKAGLLLTVKATT